MSIIPDFSLKARLGENECPEYTHVNIVCKISHFKIVYH